MAQTESRPDRMEKPSMPYPASPGLAAMGMKSMEELANAQTELFKMLQETHRHWLNRMLSEARLASEFANDVTKAGSIPDAVAACQEWTSRRFDRMVDDNKNLLLHSQKVMKTGALFLSNGLVVSGKDAAGAAAAGTAQGMQPVSGTSSRAAYAASAASAGPGSMRAGPTLDMPQG